MKRVFGLSLVVVSMINIGCSKSDSSNPTGAQSPVPSAVAIVKATLPASLQSVSVASFSQSSPQPFSIDSNLSTLKQRMFSPGPTDFLFRLNAVDQRLQDLADAIKQCEDTPVNIYNPPVIAPGFSFPMSLACVQTIDAAGQGISDYRVYFGKSSGFWYIADIQTNAGFATSDGEPPTMAVLAKIADSGDNAEIFQISVEKVSGTDYATITHIKANKVTSTFEVSTASSAQDGTQTLTPGANFTGVGCGVGLKTNLNLVYATGKFGQMTSCPSTATVCADATLSSTSGCTGVVDSIATLNLSDRSVINSAQAKSLVVDRTWLVGIGL